jgi:PLP dependent protein
MSISENLISIKENLPKSTRLVAVSKFHTNDSIIEAYNAGQRIFGESRVQELIEKYRTLPKDIEWHFIGHLQTNKIKNIVPFVSLIHGVDSIKLLKDINREGEKINRIIPCLLQLHIAQEESKFGFSSDECMDFIKSGEWIDLKYIKLKGFMGMATLTQNENQIHNEFRTLKNFFNEIKNSCFPSDTSFCEISMGMSDDYLIAVEEGSTMVRIGSAIFGSRY